MNSTNQPKTVCPADIFTRPIQTAPEEVHCFTPVQHNYPLEGDSDLEDASDVESDYEVQYIRHESRYDSEATMYCEEEDFPKIRPRNNRIIRDTNEIIDFSGFSFQPKTVARKDSLSPTEFFVYTEEIGPGGDEDDSDSLDTPDQPDTADNTDVENDTESDCDSSDTTEDTLVEDSWVYKN
ncbi:hypothetical protein CJU89_5978 [Yarrowia sp. B02]|nr:hypothetical protein CJU89_5978 [Yarrowia sp. B02]